MHLDTLKLVEKLNLPFPWETNARGQIIITPVNYAHSYHVGRLIRVLAGIAPDWESGCQLGIMTSDGMKAPDLILAGPAYHVRHQGKDGYVTEAPEICIEVMSPSDAWPEMRDKMPLYFEVGAQEVWIVDTDGRISFYAPGNEQLPRSRLIPATPRNL
jgi:Uma2 family endonuclease